ncbi:LysM peptidoglycan-binding domain-containing protein [Lysinibacillus sp. BW-2-10]|uniref:cell division suppressor protein YneA n=1 Tax=Lysinibacillus sp. BW-2-10 TaxID=2590030 RepID=UPI0011807E25|nr:LysM peptidoglycan-binding domain-containing protein [Lysinibacillus sp. BW-2-10]TSI10122.1 LysM peptidoglycan-binding domain-containing protein [Lysinibacillus sp. BW-2-10]
MNWLQKNNYIVVLFIAFVIMGAFLLIMDNGDSTYEHIEINHGDTLWSLAEQYRGNMTVQAWIEKVKLENNMNHEKIIVGQVISIPVNEDSNYMAQKEAEENHTIEVASREQ